MMIRQGRDSSIQACAWATALALIFAPATANARLTEPSEETAQPDEGANTEGPVEGPSVEPETPAIAPEHLPERPTKGPTLRKVGIGLIAAGGVIAAVGLGLTISYTVLGDLRQEAADPVLAEIEHMNSIAQVGGISLVSGLTLVTVGGVIYAKGKTRADPRPVAQIRFTPALGGLVVSGRF